MTTLMQANYNYQVGGSLPQDAPTYVIRQADADLFEGAITGNFCYVLNSRQMGKSSLRVRTMKKLYTRRVACGVIDLMEICSWETTLEQWYASVTYTLASSFNLLDEVDIPSWWEQQENASPIQRLENFIREILLVKVTQNLVIFVDEIDSVLRLGFKVDDFFALIRSCYQQRFYSESYQRLTWVLLGVATPSELIQDSRYTPFDLGREIQLTGFKLYECHSLHQGLASQADNPQAVMREILAWTGGKPFLTQKLCQLVANSRMQIPADEEAAIVAQLVHSKIIENWEAKDEPEHLRSIRNRVLHSSKHSRQLLQLYRQILLQGEIPADDSPVQIELRLSGLVVKEEVGKLYAQPILRVYNRIYGEVFNLQWLQEQEKPETLLSDELPINHSNEHEQVIYDHFLFLVHNFTPQGVIERFEKLLLGKQSYPEPEIATALRWIVLTQRNQQIFNYFLNRCCYILINYWRYQNQEGAIASLISLFQSSVVQKIEANPARGNTRQRLRKLVHIFSKSEEYLGLQSLFLAPIIDEKKSNSTALQKRSNSSPLLHSYIYRYPYLYHHCLLSQKSRPEYRQVIQRIQAERQWQFALNLSQYAAYLVRKEKRNQANSPNNPTLLSDEELYLSLQQFVGKVEGSYSQKDIAHIFMNYKAKACSYEHFKRLLYDYLVASIPKEYGKHNFFNRLKHFLTDTNSASNAQPLNEFLLLQTCRKLCQFLVESPQHPNHIYFVDLISNLGSRQMTSLLLKVVLLSGKVKPDLEKRFSLLFKHYGGSPLQENLWLVHSLENLNVAFVVNFGSVDLSFISNRR